MSEIARSFRCSACGLRHTGDYECAESPECHSKWKWDAEHYDEVAVRIYQGGGCPMWFRKLSSSGLTAWHKLVPLPDGSPRDHGICDDWEFFAAHTRTVEATAVPVGESPFTDQELYDKLRERSGQNQAILKRHMSRMRDRYGEGVGDGGQAEWHRKLRRWACDSGGKHVTGSIPVDKCSDCSGRWCKATPD